MSWVLKGGIGKGRGGIERARGFSPSPKSAPTFESAVLCPSLTFPFETLHASTLPPSKQAQPVSDLKEGA